MILDHQKGLVELKRRLTGSALDEFNVHEARLLDIIRRENLYGGASSEKWAVIDQLNQLSLRHLKVSFNELCMQSYEKVAAADSSAGTESVSSSDVTESDFADLEIRVFPRGKFGYPVELTLEGQQNFPRGYLSPEMAAWVPSGDAMADGAFLFAELFSTETLKMAWAKAEGQSSTRRIRLWIDIDAPELHALPWELLSVDRVLVSADARTPFSRYLPTTNPWGETVWQHPVRVLAVISNPSDIDLYDLVPLEVDKERENLKSAIGDGKVQLDFLDSPATMGQLADTLRNGGYHILHYVGHGRFSRQRQQAVLYFQNDMGDTKPVTDDVLCDLLAHQGVQPHVVYLAACQSATRSTSDAFMGLGPKLIRAGVPAVVAMQDRVQIQTARKFGRVFYEQLVRHRIVDLAANQARAALLAEEHTDLVVPVLFMRLETGQLWGC